MGVPTFKKSVRGEPLVQFLDHRLRMHGISGQGEGFRSGHQIAARACQRSAFISALPTRQA